MELEGSLPYSQQPAMVPTLSRMNKVQAALPISVGSTQILSFQICPSIAA
jgi:hypothetical protein